VQADGRPDQRAERHRRRHERQAAPVEEEAREAHEAFPLAILGLWCEQHAAPGGDAILSRDRWSKLAEDLLANPTFASTLASAFQRGLATKGALDRNVQMVLGLLNLPSRADISRILTKLEVIQASLLNLHAKLDRVAAEGKRPRKPRARKPRTNAGTQPSNG
jgi:hypothetical protein